MNIGVTCPYCEAINRVHVQLHEANNGPPKIVTCIGCGKYFAAQFHLAVNVDIYQIRQTD